MELKKYNFPQTQYIKEVSGKNQIVLHHTVSMGNAINVINYWKSNSEKVATHFIIEKDGTIYQLYDIKYWAYHIGNTNKEFNHFQLQHRNCSKYSIGIELVNQGGLIYKKGKYYNTYNKECKCEIIKLDKPFRGYKYFEKYTVQQIKSAIELIQFLSNNLKINIKYNYKDIFTTNEDALKGKSGLFSHVSFRFDKSDISPQPHLIKLLEDSFK